MIEHYSHAKHFHLIEDWLSTRQMPVPEQGMIYDTGFVVDGIAVGFLCKTNSKLAFIDQVATKPGLPELVREDALDELFLVLAEEAANAGFWVVAALAGSSNMERRFSELGFKPNGKFALMSADLPRSKSCRG